MNQNGKIIEIVAGPNGSGKSTFGDIYFGRNSERNAFLNPDIIAAGISRSDFAAASIHAGRILITEVKSRIFKGESFCFESTLSGKTWVPVLRQAKVHGYSIKIYFLYLENVSLNLDRIEKRVSLGGHPVPREAVERRYPRCFSNFWNLYRIICDDWYVFDNSGLKPVRLMDKSTFLSLSTSRQKEFEAGFLARSIHGS